MFKLNINIAQEDPFTYAGFTRRVCAYLTDVFIVAMTGLSISIIIYYLNNGVYSAGSPFKQYLFFGLAATMVIYSALMNISKYKGTVGKIFFKISVVNYKGENITVLQSFLRELLKMATVQIFAPLFLFMFFSKRNRTLHDFAAKTLVIKKPRFFVNDITEK
jgi:uncharacterized RDD family membrane protein YckC